MVPKKNKNQEVSPEVAEEPSFAERVRTEYESAEFELPEWSTNLGVGAFVKAGSDALWRVWQRSNTVERTGIVAAGAVTAYVGFKILQGALDGLMSLGRWFGRQLENLRQNTLEKTLKVVLGVAAIALVPLLYQGIVKNRFSLTEVFEAWQNEGAEGLIELLRQKYPEAMRSMNADVSAFVISVIGAKRFQQIFGRAEQAIDEASDTVTEAAVPTLPDLPEIDRVFSDKTRARREEYFTNPSDETMERVLNSAAEDQLIVIKDGAIYMLGELEDLVDISAWFGLQYVEAAGEVIAAGDRDPQARVGAYVRQYLREAPKFMIIAGSIDFVSSLFVRGKPIGVFKSAMVGARLGLMWGALPIRLTPALIRVVGSPVHYARAAVDGIILMGRNMAPVVKLTQTGAMLFWNGARFVTQEVLKRTTAPLAKALGGALSAAYQRTIKRQVARFTGSAFMKRLGAVAGWKGATAAALWADDSTVVGVVDDPVAIALTIWMAADVVHLIKITNRMQKFKRLMAEQEQAEIVEIEPVDEPTRARYEAWQEEFGDHPDVENLMVDALFQMPLARFKIHRDNGRSEGYTLVRGNVVACWITEGDEQLAYVAEEDIETLTNDIPPPGEFTKQAIDYNQGPDTLVAQYRLAIRYIQQETGWTQLGYELIDADTVIIRRALSGVELMLHRRGDQWYLGEDGETGFDFFQAVSLANLFNKVEEMVRGEGAIPKRSKPFYVDGSGIYLNRNLNDTQVVGSEAEGWLVDFYAAELGLAPDEIVESLNDHYLREIRPRRNEPLNEE